MTTNTKRIEQLVDEPLNLRSFVEEMTERYRRKPDDALGTAWVGLVAPLEKRLSHLGVRFEYIPTKYLDLLIEDSVRCRTWAAMHPEVTPQQLRLLAKDRNGKVKAKVFENPNCPIDLLENAVKRRSKPEIRNLVVCHRNCPSEILERLAGDNEAEVRASVARHRNCPIEILERLAGDSDPQVRKSCVHNPALPVSSLLDMGVDPDPEVNIYQLKRKDFPDELVAPLVDALVDRERMYREIVAEHPRCPADFLRRLEDDPEERVRVRVAANPNCPIDLLDRLGKDESHKVRSRAMENRACPAELRRSVQLGLADSKDFQAHRSLAKSPSCPPELLTRLAGAKGGDYATGYSANEIRGAVASRSDCPESAMEVLARTEEDDKYGSVTAKLASNPACSPELRSASLAQMETNPAREIDLAGNPHSPPELLEKLSRSGLKSADHDRSDPKSRDSVRVMVARNPNCPPHVLERLANDSSVINAVMNNPACPVAVLERVARSDRWYRGMGLNSRGCPEAVRQFVIADCIEPPCEISTLEDLQRYGLPALAQPSCSKSQIRKAAKSTDWCERLCVALNSAASVQMLTALMDDARSEVRIAAARTLRGKRRK